MCTDTDFSTLHTRPTRPGYLSTRPTSMLPNRAEQESVPSVSQSHSHEQNARNTSLNPAHPTLPSPRKCTCSSRMPRQIPPRNRRQQSRPIIHKPTPTTSSPSQRRLLPNRTHRPRQIRPTPHPQRVPSAPAPGSRRLTRTPPSPRPRTRRRRAAAASPVLRGRGLSSCPANTQPSSSSGSRGSTADANPASTPAASPASSSGGSGR